jgi:uncharacterized membrane protein
MSLRKPCLPCMIVAASAISLLALAISVPVRALVRKTF